MTTNLTNKQFGKYPIERILELKETFIRNPGIRSIKHLSELSKEIVGHHVDMSALLEFQRDDPKGSWTLQRNLYQANNKEEVEEADDVYDELNVIRRRVFEAIDNSGKDGLLLYGDFDQDEAIKAVKDIPGVKYRDFKPGALDASLINAYMNILQKAKIEVKVASSAKTPLQQAIEVARDTFEEFEN